MKTGFIHVDAHMAPLGRGEEALQTHNRSQKYHSRKTSCVMSTGSQNNEYDHRLQTNPCTGKAILKPSRKQSNALFSTQNRMSHTAA